jgi:NAD(P)-dependent dehydrogenase (short-subunit alcohol dehydrogenase family)
MVQAEPHSELKDKVVVVTGAARGMGRAYVEGFLASGARISASDKSWSGAEDFQKEIQAQGSLALEMDVTNQAQIDAAFKATMDAFGTVDVILNNAALLNMFLYPPSGRVTTLETTDDDWDKSLDVNVRGPLRVIRTFIGPMIEKKSGSIISVVSSGLLMFSRGGGYTAMRPQSKEMPYMATKAALANVSYYLADEIKEHNVAVNIIFPGHTRASWYDNTVRSRVAVGMNPGIRPVSVKHIVPIALFLASQDANGVTGKMFDTMEWNKEHGLGGYDEWQDPELPEDLNQAFLDAGVPPAKRPESAAR